MAAELKDIFVGFGGAAGATAVGLKLWSHFSKTKVDTSFDDSRLKELDRKDRELERLKDIVEAKLELLHAEQRKSDRQQWKLEAQEQQIQRLTKTIVKLRPETYDYLAKDTGFGDLNDEPVKTRKR